MAEVAPDGSPVAVYLRLPAGDTPALVHDAIPANATILELGSGVGRITHPLLALGHRILAVDNSAAMLRHVHGAQTLLADVTTLRLSDRFDVALLASHLINVPDKDERRRLFAVCQTHVHPGGIVLIERYPVEWARTVSDVDHQIGEVTISWHDVRHDGELFHAAVTYTVDGRSWTQRFTGRILDDASLRAEANAAGLALDAWFGAEREWARLIA